MSCEGWTIGQMISFLRERVPELRETDNGDISIVFQELCQESEKAYAYKLAAEMLLNEADLKRGYRLDERASLHYWIEKAQAEIDRRK
jgi:hypothetical protein